MSRKKASKRMGRRKAVTVLGAAGALSVAGSASAAIVGPAEDITEKDISRHVITLSEEEVFDVSLATFYVFDKEDARAHPPGVQLAAKGGHGGCRHGGRGHDGARGCGGCCCIGLDDPQRQGHCQVPSTSKGERSYHSH